MLFTLELILNLIFDFIKINNPVESHKLNENLSQFDIGLAIEPKKDLNNNLALSNKILCYFQSGTYILATETSAQKLFLQQHPQHGISVKDDFNNFDTVLNQVINNIEIIRRERTTRFNISQNYNWEKESEPLLYNWKI